MAATGDTGRRVMAAEEGELEQEETLEMLFMIYSEEDSR